MNEQKKTDFFPATGFREEEIFAPETYLPYRETAEDILHEERLNELEAQINGKFGAGFEADFGVLPDNPEADTEKWDELEKDFDRVFDEAEKRRTLPHQVK